MVETVRYGRNYLLQLASGSYGRNYLLQLVLGSYGCKHTQVLDSYVECELALMTLSFKKIVRFQ